MNFQVHIADSIAADTERVLAAWQARAQQAGLPAYPELAADAHRRELLAHVAGNLANGHGPAQHQPELIELLDTLLKLRSGEPDPVLLLRDLGNLGAVLLAELPRWARAFPGGEAPVEAVLESAARLAAIPREFGELVLEVHRDERRASDTRSWQRVGRFADMLSHALNQPLNAAVLTTQLLEYTDGTMRSAEAQVLLEQLRRNLLRTDAVLRDARAAALSRALTADGGRVAFGQVLGEVMAELSSELHARGLQLLVEEPVADASVPEARVRLVLLSLIRHLMRAVDGEPCDGVIRVQCARAFQRPGWIVEVSTEDGQAPASHAASNGGSAAGAAGPQEIAIGVELAREEIQLLGGELDVGGPPQWPTSFRFRLPAAVPGA